MAIALAIDKRAATWSPEGTVTARDELNMA